LLLALLLPPLTGRSAGKPNVLLFCVDDLNQWFGYLGRNQQTPTPNLDRFARRGVWFTRSYCAAPVCNHTVRSETWRYTHYSDGGEELYSETKAPCEWSNLAGKSGEFDPPKTNRRKQRPRRPAPPLFSPLPPV